MTYILKVLVGSRAHGLHSDTSDYDYRGVFVHPTSTILSIGIPKPPETGWIEGDQADSKKPKVDDTSWEVGHFLSLATKSNPSILEVFRAPVVAPADLHGATWTPSPLAKLAVQKDGLALQELFDAVWSPRAVRDAFIGYGHNQRKKFLEGKDERPAKFGVAYLRVLLQAERLLVHGVMQVNMRHHPEFGTLMAIKTGCLSFGAVIDKCKYWEEKVEAAYRLAESKMNRPMPDYHRVNAWLLDLRRRYWMDEEGRALRDRCASESP